ncbi:MAG: DUF3999 family protein [Flammeovirgaceae bacterium]
MKRMIRNSIWIVLVLTFTQLRGQMANYQFFRELQGSTDTWHSISVPPEMYAKTQPSLADIRIYGVKSNGDTIEAPFFLNEHNWELKTEEVDFKLINQASSGGDAFFIFQVPTNDIINRIQLDFSNANFDWRVTLEGSQDQQQWFTVKERQRILSIRNAYTDYTYSTIRFPDSKYQYWRVRVSGKGKPRLNRAYLRKVKIMPGNYRIYPIVKFQVSEDQERKETQVAIDLLNKVPVTYVQLHVKDSFDYYRPLQIKYRIGNQTAQAVYRDVSTGILSSFEDNDFQFASKKTDGIRCIIDNRDNQALQIESARVIGPAHSLTVRFTQEANYYLVYGNTKAQQPSYDIVMFKDKIPTELTELTLGQERETSHIPAQGAKPLFTNQLWLWVILVVLVVVIGGFGMKMLKGD